MSIQRPLSLPGPLRFGYPSLDSEGQFLYEMGSLVFIFGKTARVAKVSRSQGITFHLDTAPDLSLLDYTGWFTPAYAKIQILCSYTGIIPHLMFPICFTSRSSASYVSYASSAYTSDSQPGGTAASPSKGSRSSGMGWGAVRIKDCLITRVGL